MSPETERVAILLADISGSTPLYETVGDAQAQRLIGMELKRLQTAIRDAGVSAFVRKGTMSLPALPSRTVLLRRCGPCSRGRPTSL